MKPADLLANSSDSLRGTKAPQLPLENPNGASPAVETVPKTQTDVLPPWKSALPRRLAPISLTEAKEPASSADPAQGNVDSVLENAPDGQNTPEGFSSADSDAQELERLEEQLETSLRSASMMMATPSRVRGLDGHPQALQGVRRSLDLDRGAQTPEK